MCGIVGIIRTDAGGISDKHIKMFESLLLVSQLRGEDGTGVMWLNKDAKQVSFVKDAVPARKFFISREWKTAKERLAGTNTLIGHCRFRTRGSNNTANTHPFVLNNTFGLVHNGSLPDSDNDRTIYDYAVDSLFMAERIHKNGFDALKDISGAAAIAVLNSVDNSVCLFRNNERPMFFLQEENTFIFASQKHFLEAIFPQLNSPEKAEVFMTKDDTLIRINLDDPLTFVNTTLKMQTAVKYKDFDYFKGPAYVSSVSNQKRIPLISTPAPLGEFVNLLSIKRKRGRVTMSVEFKGETLKALGVELAEGSFPSLKELTIGKHSFKLDSTIGVEISDIIECGYGSRGNKGQTYRVEGYNPSFPGVTFYGYVSDFTDEELLTTMHLKGNVSFIRVLNKATCDNMDSPFASLLVNIKPEKENPCVI
jgi:predicted glutamine amidotransferase